MAPPATCLGVRRSSDGWGPCGSGELVHEEPPTLGLKADRFAGNQPFAEIYFGLDDDLRGSNANTVSGARSMYIENGAERGES